MRGAYSMSCCRGAIGGKRSRMGWCASSGLDMVGLDWVELDDSTFLGGARSLFPLA